MIGEGFCAPDCCVCGNGECQTDPCDEGWEEDLWTCATDCAHCGNGTCDPGEKPSLCWEDCCGACGDGMCKCTENPVDCPDDCGNAACGDDGCGGDCGDCPAGVCVDDGKIYQHGLYCNAGVCVPLEFDECNDDSFCTTDSCDPTQGCLHDPTNEGQICEDGDICRSLDDDGYRLQGGK